MKPVSPSSNLTEKRLPARDGKTPSNYVENSKGEVWYKPLPAPKLTQESKPEQKTHEDQ
jgi:hypothetical protein